MIRKIKIILLCFTVFLFAFSLMACNKTKSDKEKKGPGIYYSDNDGVKLVKVNINLNTDMNPQLGAEDLIDEMRDVGKKSNYRSAIPDKVVVNNVTVVNNVVNVDFSTGYKKISSSEDLICRAAIVYTLTQIKSVNYVEFSVAGQSMLDTDGKAYGALSKDSFVFGDLPVDLEN